MRMLSVPPEVVTPAVPSTPPSSPATAARMSAWMRRRLGKTSVLRAFSERYSADAASSSSWTSSPAL
jgi:hypothetical protein